MSIAQVARRYGMNTNLIHKWLRDPKFAPYLKTVEEQIAPEPSFLPVEIVDRPVTEEPTAILAVNAAFGQNAIEIDTAGGHQLRIVGSYDPKALASSSEVCLHDPCSGEHAGLACG
ncbi:IS66 family insertion sequence element accessory protein TnpB [Epibacterium ulvae]|uniref:IS66 family insertion sequence element accessory protein TnpB n=1 Tax=Epibacterium ulvae TaxID=1156985 RepID=UPI00204048B0|nr:IS66 family insertion sequence element accessory protein TnpB [Epibacterium ulvae]